MAPRGTRRPSRSLFSVPLLSRPYVAKLSLPFRRPCRRGGGPISARPVIDAASFRLVLEHVNQLVVSPLSVFDILETQLCSSKACGVLQVLFLCRLRISSKLILSWVFFVSVLAVLAFLRADLESYPSGFFIHSCGFILRRSVKSRSWSHFPSDSKNPDTQVLTPGTTGFHGGPGLFQVYTVQVQCWCHSLACSVMRFPCRFLSCPAGRFHFFLDPRRRSPLQKVGLFLERVPFFQPCWDLLTVP